MTWRSWWIVYNPNGNIDRVTHMAPDLNSNQFAKGCTAIHVIEKSAYDRLEASLASQAQVNKTLSDEVLIYMQERDAALEREKVLELCLNWYIENCEVVFHESAGGDGAPTGTFPVLGNWDHAREALEKVRKMRK